VAKQGSSAEKVHPFREEGGDREGGWWDYGASWKVEEKGQMEGGLRQY